MKNSQRTVHKKGGKKRKNPNKKAKNRNSIDLSLGYFVFLKRFSTNERYNDKDRYQKIKITSNDKFEDCVLEVCEKLSGSGNSEKTSLFCSPIDGVDDILSAYANFSNINPGIRAVFADINPYKIDYFTFRLFLTQISGTREEYLRNLFFYIKGDNTDPAEVIIDKAARINVSKELHIDYIMHLIKQNIPDRVANLRKAVRKGIALLDVIRDGKTHYKNLAKLLKNNISLNPKTHWLGNESLYQLVRQGCRDYLIKVIQANMNKGGKEFIKNLLTSSDTQGSVLFLPKGKKKFRGSSDLVDVFDHSIDTRPPLSKRDKFRIWHLIEPGRFLSTPQFEHEGELSNTQLMRLTEDYKRRSSIEKRFYGRCNLMFMGDVPFGRIYLDDRSRTFLENVQNYANKYNVEHIAICGDLIDGCHAREKRKLAFMQYLSDEPTPSIERQCLLAKEFLNGFNGKVYTVASDGDWDIIEEKQRELINQKEFQYKIEKSTGHVPDHVRKSLRVEAVFEAAKEYYDYFENQVGPDEAVGDALNLSFDAAKISITHMSIGQYFRKSLSRQVGVKEQKIINQFDAMHGIDDDKNISIKVSSHDNVLQAHMETEKTMNLKVPSLESPANYEKIPIQLRNAVQDMMHKAFSVRGKIPFPAACKVEVTKDGRILLTLINEKILDMIDRYKNSKAEEYLIYTLTDVHVGSIVHRYDYLLKYLDYVKEQAKKLQKKTNMKKVGRIALFNGDIIEGINYATAMMRNSVTRISFPQTQMTCAIELMKPFFFTEHDGQLHLDKDLEHVVITHGNHEYNSGFIHSGMMATQTLYQYFKAHMEREYDEETVKNKLMYSLFVKLDKHRTLFSSVGAFSKLGLNVHMMHSYGGGVNMASAAPPQERWVTRIGNLARPWDILIQGHYHQFSLGEIAGKVLLSFPSFTEISDFEYERGLDSPLCATLLHLSSKYGLVVEILTRDFLDHYKPQHELFKKMSLKKFYDSCVEKALEPADLSQFQ